MYICSNCGHTSIKWLGKCPNCDLWDTFIQKQDDSINTSFNIAKQKSSPVLLKDVQKQKISRIKTGIEQLDEVLGGGLVTGEVILVGGEPGVGKSTLLLEVAANLSKQNKTLYVSAEESLQQVSLRAERLKSDFSNLYILSEDNVDQIYSYIQEFDFKFVIVDSIQVIYSSKFEGPKGSVNQLKGCADLLTQIAKNFGLVVFIVGHVTKEGLISGPKLLEHIVDCVLYFEGENISNYRILRATKNRFGATGQIAVFEMTSVGLKEVKKTSEIFIPHKLESIVGSSIVSVLEGTRPIMIELQSLVSKASFGLAKRRSLGFDFNRFSVLVAIIEKRLKIPLATQDIFLNVAGGLKITDPAADLGVVVSIVSSFKEKPPKKSSVFIGEVGLSGELRAVSNINLRLKEIERVNFKYCFIPEQNLDEIDKKYDFQIKGYSLIKDVIETVFD